MQTENTRVAKPCKIRCQKCNEIAAIIYFESTGRSAIKVDGFLGTITARRVGLSDVTKDLYEWIVRTILVSPGEVHALDYDIFGFICGECKKVYCKNCWQEAYPEFDPDWPIWFEVMRGTCPMGHSQILQD